MKRVDIGDRLAIERDDDVPLENPRRIRRPAALDSQDEDAARHSDLMITNCPALERDRLTRHTDVASSDASFVDEFSRDEFRGVDRDGKTEPLGGHDHRGVDADHFASRIDERTAGVPRIQRGVGLDDIIDQTPRRRA